MPKYLVKGIFQHSVDLKLYNVGDEADFEKEEADRINEKLKDVYPVTLEALEPTKATKAKKEVKEEAKED